MKLSIVGLSLLLAGSAIAQAADDSGIRAARFWSQAEVSARPCDLMLDTAKLDDAAIRAGMSAALANHLRHGVSLTHDDPDLLAQQAAADDVIREMPQAVQNRGALAFCQMVWDRFGPHGNIFPNALRLPQRPYSPFDLR